MNPFIQLLAALVSTAGFCLLYHIRAQLVPFSALGGVLSWGFYLLLERADAAPFYPVLFSGVFTAVYSELMAKCVRAPATIFLIPALIPLVPGGSLYYTMLALVERDEARFRQQGMLTLQWVVALAAGISLVAVARQILKTRRR